jgi:hypothetical protein
MRGVRRNRNGRSGRRLTALPTRFFARRANGLRRREPLNPIDDARARPLSTSPKGILQKGRAVKSLRWTPSRTAVRPRFEVSVLRSPQTSDFCVGDPG